MLIGKVAGYSLTVFFAVFRRKTVDVCDVSGKKIDREIDRNEHNQFPIPVHMRGEDPEANGVRKRHSSETFISFHFFLTLQTPFDSLLIEV
jgi:hypothetical protein